MRHQRRPALRPDRCAVEVEGQPAVGQELRRERAAPQVLPLPLCLRRRPCLQAGWPHRAQAELRLHRDPALGAAPQPAGERLVRAEPPGRREPEQQPGGPPEAGDRPAARGGRRGAPVCRAPQALAHAAGQRHARGHEPHDACPGLRGVLAALERARFHRGRPRAEAAGDGAPCNEAHQDGVVRTLLGQTPAELLRAAVALVPLLPRGVHLGQHLAPGAALLLARFPGGRCGGWRRSRGLRDCGGRPHWHPAHGLGGGGPRDEAHRRREAGRPVGLGWRRQGRRDGFRQGPEDGHCGDAQGRVRHAAPDPRPGSAGVPADPAAETLAPGHSARVAAHRVQQAPDPPAH
mmetsp:Transcript_12879/g.40462  ORF Transcript_12879/g.40462 Transcript_12879/m.40462 type:complete len:348 (-) Transcript_12879:266-1309(-)